MTAVFRTAYVSSERMDGWVERFSASHGQLGLAETDDGVLLTAADGATALLQSAWPADGRPGQGAGPLERLISLAAQSRTIAVVLLRRGGYSVGLCRSGRLLESKSGTRYVQSRTAAGGWSQQRFARRRANQADALVEVVAAHALRLFAGSVTQPAEYPVMGGDKARDYPGVSGGMAPEYLVLGGDKALCHALLAEPAASSWAGLPQLAFRDVPDPRLAVLQQVAKDLSAVRIQVTDPAPQQLP
ncbi:acVLRF1 family peptidyl-tRNA hydrolase [Paenarthrobacter sp. Z7-10]|uniref:acVLRF1 family peptidyl-tRNA hydrolase n=1 Tax=Paenarthrobacter sp. Z7-10 TaxID=2787635 RepID=UPI0022A9C29F|nr:acVLRF1 family peptidyl-tRNA hydrolase [Paenarthrobacter sp. Z7-10]